MKVQIQNMVRLANRTGFCERVFPITQNDYDFVCVELSSVKALPYQQAHSFVLKVTVHRRFETDRVREFRKFEQSGNIIHDTDVVTGLLWRACADMGVTIDEFI